MYVALAIDRNSVHPNTKYSQNNHKRTAIGNLNVNIPYTFYVIKQVVEASFILKKKYFIFDDIISCTNESYLLYSAIYILFFSTLTTLLQIVDPFRNNFEKQEFISELHPCLN